MQTDGVAKKLAKLAKEGDARFLEIGKLLRNFYDGLTEEDGPKGEALRSLLKGTKISRRRALYWIEIDRVYGDVGVKPERLAQIGWTKLSLAAKYVDDENAEAWLNFIEKGTAEALRAFLKGQDLPAHTLTFKLSDKQYGLIAGTLLANGAYLTSGAGLGSKETALLLVCAKANKLTASQSS